MTLAKDAKLAEKVSKELHAIPPDEMLPTEKKYMTHQDMDMYFAQREDNERHLGSPALPLPRFYHVHDYFPTAPLHAFIRSFLP